VFTAAIDAGLGIAAVIGLVGSVVAAFYYLRLIKVMWFDPAVGATDKPPLEARLIAVALALFTFPVVVLALGWLDPLAARAAHAFGLA
jgi:NADH-quinone oxidoreductase subunit N